ncbi:hypothetical protein [Nostoc sp. UHCC 0251]|uniref:hypothetical protein n=1 Tax=Nostoc sp. UHCC 0251 TaxID=3110240 RepID=UPI002B206FBB|nr:hypothetical protein [Nostoc sp. UHCC 0251]MEA5628371.1 hypothetical protein [Nostoc sp. UHCC 0251]
MDSCLELTGLGYQFYFLFFPLYGLMASRYRREVAVTAAPAGWDLHPHGHSVVMVM